MQLDIFDHSRDVMLRNDVAIALERHDAAAARSAWQALLDAFPLDDAVPSLALLVGTLEQRSNQSFKDHDAVREARQALIDAVHPACLRVFGPQGGAAWMIPLWQEMAQRSAWLAFRSDRSDEHAAALWLRAGSWAAACEAVSRIESWRRIPAPLAWMAEARFHLDGLDAVWPLLAELAWLSPNRLDALLRRLGDPSLNQLRKKFDASFEGDGSVEDIAWLPAWALTEQAALARLLREAQPSRDTAPERAMRLLLELLNLERQGRHHELVDRRKALRDVHPWLYAAYMKTR